MIGGSRRVDHQPGRVGIADEIVDIDPARLQQFVDDGQNQQPVCARPDPDPVVGYRRIARANGIDRDETRAVSLELRDANLQRIGIVILRHAEHDKELGALPVRRAEFPEGAADCHNAGGCHVDRAKAAMRGIVGRSILLRPEAGQRLRLIAAGEKGEFLRVRLPNAAKPVGGKGQRLIPRNFLELARAARARAQERRAKPGRSVVLHDSGRALGA